MTFKIGDKIGSIYGTGEVVCDDFLGPYPVQVKFDNSQATRAFREDGREVESHLFPSIWHLKTGSPPVIGEGPEREPWIPDGLTPCWVWNDCADKLKSLVFRASFSQPTQYESIGERGILIRSQYAEPLPKDEIPEWMKF